MSESPSLDTTFVITDRNLGAETIAVTDRIWQELDERYGDFNGRTLVSCFEFSEPWPTWEMHPAGDEIVVLLEGDTELVLAETPGDRTVRLDTPGQFAIVPKGTWHTARPSAPTRMMFVTPGEGTENRPMPPGRDSAD